MDENVDHTMGVGGGDKPTPLPQTIEHSTQLLAYRDGHGGFFWLPLLQLGILPSVGQRAE